MESPGRACLWVAIPILVGFQRADRENAGPLPGEATAGRPADRGPVAEIAKSEGLPGFLLLESIPGEVGLEILILPWLFDATGDRE